MQGVEPFGQIDSSAFKTTALNVEVGGPSPTVAKDAF